MPFDKIYFMKSVTTLNEFILRSDGYQIVVPPKTKIYISSKSVNESKSGESMINKDILIFLRNFVNENKRFTTDLFDRKIGQLVSNLKLTNEGISNLFHIYGYKIEDNGTHFLANNAQRYAFGANVLNEDESQTWSENNCNDMLGVAKLRLKYLPLKNLNPGLTFNGDTDNCSCDLDGNTYHGDEIIDNIPVEWISAAKENNYHVLEFIKEMGLADFNEHGTVDQYHQTSNDLAVPDNVADQEITLDDIPF